MFQKLVKKYLIVMIISVLIGLFIYMASSNIVKGIVNSSLTEIAKQGTLLVKKDIEAHMNILVTISQAKNINRPELSLAERVSILDGYTSIDKFLRLSIADAEGNVMATDRAVITVKDRAYFEKAIAGINNISEPLISRIDGRTVIIFAVPLMYEGHSVGILSATYPIQELSDIVEGIHYAGKGYAYILDGKSQIIAHGEKGFMPELSREDDLNAQSQSTSRYTELKQRMVSGETGAGDYEEDGQERYMGFAPIAGTSWSLAITATKDEVLSDMNRLLTFLILLVITFSLSIFIINIYLIYLKKRVRQHIITSQNAVDIARMLILSFGTDGMIFALNRYAEEIIGCGRDDIVGKKSIYELIDDTSKAVLGKICAQQKAGVQAESFELCFNGAMGPVYILFNINQSEVTLKKNQQTEVIEVIGVDLTDRVKAEKSLNEKHEELSQVYEELSASQDELHSQFERIYQLAFYDTLTKLPNRSQFQQHLSDLLRDRHEKSITVMIIDIDNFKYINDTFGYHYGNITLKEAAERLMRVSGGQIFVSRLNGDEFSIVFSQPFYNEPDLVHLTEVIFDVFRAPFMVGNIKLNMTASIGIAANLDRSVEADTLLSYADAAMNKAKERGKNCYVFFDKSMTKEISDKLIMTNYLRDAIENNEFRLFYQPIYHSSSEEIVSFEGLLRWNNPTLGNVPPSEFIKLAEESGLIQSIGLWVLREGCIFARRINEGRERSITVSINVSPLQMIQESFVDSVQRVLAETGVNPSLIAIEITESALIEVFDSCHKKLEILSGMGIRVYLDDFGTGYSSLNYLSKLPIAVIKLDRSFIWEVLSDHKVRQLTQTIINLAHQMEMDTVAEGVETVEQLHLLKEYACDMVQGYLFSKPLPEESAMALLKKIA